MSAALTIRNLNEKKAEASPIPHDFLPKPCFRLVVVGCSHSGKSNMLKNLLTLPEYGYKEYYGENIFIFSKTLDLDDTWKKIDEARAEDAPIHEVARRCGAADNAV